MKAWEIIGWTYEADMHCPRCSLKRFGAKLDAATDSEGNEVHPIFAVDEHSPEGEYCGDCGREIWEPLEEA